MNWVHFLRHYIYRNPLTIVIGVIIVLFFSRSTLFQSSLKPIFPSIPKVVVKPMAAKLMMTSMQLNGQTEEARRVTLRTKTGGRILSLLATKGQKVNAGEELVRIDPENRLVRLAEAKAKLHQRSLELAANTKLEAKAVKSQNALAACMADYEAAKSSLALIEQEIADTHIKAPFEGVFEETFVEMGDVTTVGEKIATIIELNPLKIICNISEKDVSRLKIGEKADVILPSLQDRKLPAQVTYIGKIADPKTRTYRVEMQADNPDMVISSGLTARITFPTGQANGYMVSTAVISLRDDGAVGVKTVEGGKVVFYPVQIIETKPEGLLVTGLPNHISLITTGGDFVVEGQEVETSTDAREGSPDGGNLEKSP
jgi:multidrug efflux system membrane fusion protein